MSKLVCFEVRDVSQFREGSTKTIFARSFASDIANHLLQDVFPLTPNVRQPTSNRVTDSIIHSIETDEQVEIQSPLFLVARDAFLNNQVLAIDFGELGGMIDGGHRLLALKKAKLRGLDLTKVRLNWQIFVGLSGAEINKIAIAVNTSNNPQRSSIYNFQGKYDWMKPCLRQYKIAYYENQENVPKDIASSINRIESLIYLLDTNFNPSRPIQCKGKMLRHPIKIASSGFNRDTRDTRKVWEHEDITHLLSDVVELQTIICLEIEAYNNKKKLPFVTYPKDVRQLTHLPTGQILSVKLPSKLYLYPIFSSFRAVLCPETVKWNVKNIKVFVGKITKRMIARYAEILNQQRFLGRTAESICVDEYVWDIMYSIVYDAWISSLSE